MFWLPSNEHNNNKIMRFSYEIICHAKIPKAVLIQLETGDQKKGQMHALGRFNLITTINKIRNVDFRILIELNISIQYIA